MTDFIKQFHNLEGYLMNDRRKNYFKLLKRTSINSNQTIIDEALQNIQPRTYQEKLFWVETLLYFKKTAPLIELLKQGNKTFTKIILKQKWFIQDAFNNITPEELVNDFFHCISYSIKLKILRRISNYWNETKMDELFTALQLRYGLFMATEVLHACSIRKIKMILSDNEIVLSTFQVIYMLNKNEDMFKIYVDHINSLLKKPYAEENVINLIALKNSKLFLELLKSNKIHTKKLTKAATIRILTTVKKEILDDPLYFLNMLNKRALVTQLGSDSMSFIKSTFPKEFDKFDSKCDSIQLLKYFPKHRRWDLLVEMYQTNFRTNTMEELFTQLDDTILKLIPNNDIIRLWAETNYKATNDTNYLTYYATSSSIPVIKEKINVTSDMRKRHTLIKLLITSCAYNKDKETLDEVLEYIGSRHKNEDANAFNRIIGFIFETFDKSELTRNQWNFIRQQMILIRTGGKVDFFYYKSTVDKLLGYTYEHDRELFKKIASEYIEDTSDSIISLKVRLENPKLETGIFRDICNFVPIVLSAEHKNYNIMLTIITSDIWDICKAHPDYCLNLLEFPYILDNIQAKCNKSEDLDGDDELIIKSAILYHLNFPKYPLPFLNESKIFELLQRFNYESNNVYEMIANIAEKKTVSNVEENILKFFFEKMNTDIGYCTFKNNILKWTFLYRPKLIFSNFNRIWSNTTYFYTMDYYGNLFKHYSHLGLNSKIYQFLEKNISDASREHQENAIRILQNMLPEEEFIEFVNKYFCPEKTGDSFDHTLKVKVQHFIAKSLKNVNEPSKFLELVTKFCKDDYFKFALPSLYSLFYRSPENFLHTHLKTLSQQAVPVKKHALILNCALLDRNHVINFLKAEDACSSSYKKHLCLATLKYFVRNDSEDLFILFQKYLHAVDKNEKEMFFSLVKITVPKNYRAQYVETCWEILESIHDDDIKVNKFFDKLLEQLFDEVVLKSISSSFVNNIINEYLPKQGKNLLTNVDQFAILCLAYRESERENNFNAIFSVLSKLKKKTINDFCKKIVDFVNNDKLDSTFVNMFIEFWTKYFVIIDTLDEYIIINLLHKYMNNSIQLFAKNIVDYLEELISKIGPQVYEIFKNNLRELINDMKNLNRYQVYRFMLDYKSSAMTCILVIQLLTPATIEETEETKITYKNVMEILNTINDPIVKGYYEIYLRNNELIF